MPSVKKILFNEFGKLASYLTVDEGENLFNLYGTIRHQKPLNLGEGAEKTIASGAITITHGIHAVDTESDAASDDLTDINGGKDGDIVALFPADDARTVVVKATGGNISLTGDVSLDDIEDSIALVRRDSVWYRFNGA